MHANAIHFEQHPVADLKMLNLFGCLQDHGGASDFNSGLERNCNHLKQCAVFCTLFLWRDISDTSPLFADHRQSA
jgi:hypothetical protein